MSLEPETRMDFYPHPTEMGRGLIQRKPCGCAVEMLNDWPGEWRAVKAFPCRAHAQEWIDKTKSGKGGIGR